MSAGGVGAGDGGGSVSWDRLIALFRNGLEIFGLLPESVTFYHNVHLVVMGHAFKFGPSCYS